MAILIYKWLMYFSLFLGQTASPGYQPVVHPFFVSVTEMNHNSVDKTLEISCKIFTDDFETTLSKTNQKKVDLINTKDKELADKQVSEYIRKHLVIKLDGKPVSLEFIGFERESEAIWSYFQVSNSTAPKKVEVMNNLLYDSFDQQINLLHVTVSGQRKSTKLNYPEANAKFEF